MDIPARLLIHSCTYSAPASNDRDGNATYGEAVTLSNVRFEPIKAALKSDVGETKDDKLTMFYAPYISTPQIVPEPLARVSWNNVNYTVRSVQPCYTYGDAAVHHYEVALV